MEQSFIANNITDNTKKVAVLLTVIGAKAYELLHNLLAPDTPASKKYDEVVTTSSTLCHSRSRDLERSENLGLIEKISYSD